MGNSSWLVGERAAPPLTERELREYLRQRDRDWSAIPADVREQIRRPLLARLYCDLNPAKSWQPHSEYEVFSEVWKLLRTHPLQADYPDDFVALRDLVGTFFDPDATTH